MSPTQSEPVTRNCLLSGTRLRWILLHYHIFKNAGSTIEYALSRAFRDKFVTLHGTEDDSILRHEDLLTFLDREPDVMAVSSHHLRYPLPVRRDLVVFDLCFLRDPIQRLWSMYQYLRRIEASSELGKLAKTLDARAFMEILIREYPHLINDVQVNLLARGGAYTRPPSAADLTVARTVLQEMAIPGVVDIFDESLIAAEYYLQPTFPALRFQYVRQNVTPTDGDTGTRPNLREELGERSYEELRTLNRLDFALLSYAREEVLRRYEMVPDVDTRRHDFQRRCEHLRGVHGTLTGALNENQPPLARP